MKLKNFAIPLMMAFLSAASEISAGWTAFTLPLKASELEFELDPYYTSLDYYLELTKSQIPVLREKNEFIIYRTLLLSVVPRFLVLEASVNPLPCLGLAVREYAPKLYGTVAMTSDFNLVRSLTAGFDEPYAFSLFLGNVVKFVPEGAVKHSGRGYSGILVSAGNYHIKDNVLIDDWWIETEAKIKGERSTEELKMSWSFRIGLRLHQNPDIRDLFYFGLSRDRTDPFYYRLSLLRNSSVECKLEFNLKTAEPVRFLVLAGIKFPIKGTRFIPGLKMGVLWEGKERYTGVLAGTGWTSGFKFVVNPTIKF